MTGAAPGVIRARPLNVAAMSSVFIAVSSVEL
jgi:hypothetical protein